MKRRICDICKKPIYDDEDLHYRVYLFRPKEDVYKPSHPRKKKKKDICISCWSNVIDVTSGLPSAEQEPHYCRECKWSRCHINVDKRGETETYWHCLNWDGGTDEEGFCHEWERRTDDCI